MNRLKIMRETSVVRESSSEDDVEAHGLRFPVRSVTERFVRLCEDLEAQHIPSHGSWLALAQFDMAGLSSQWLGEDSLTMGTVLSEAVEGSLPIPV